MTTAAAALERFARAVDDEHLVVHGDSVVTITGHEEDREDRLSELAVEVPS
jgi:hypothetical protein